MGRPEWHESFSYEGFTLSPVHYQHKTKIKNLCSSCGGDMVIDDRKYSWKEVISSTWTCQSCTWYRDEFETDLSKVTGAIEELEGLREKLLAALARLLGEKPDSFESGDLRKAGLILHRKNPETVVGFILIDYSREQMHELVTAVTGRLEPFSRGFKLFLPESYYKLFPGSYGLDRRIGRLYNEHWLEEGSYLDRLRERKAEIESRAETIQARIAEHSGTLAAS